jgi:hypothetical protein
MAYADLLGIERFDHRRDKLRQADTRGTVRGRFANLRGNLLNVVLRVFQVEQALNPCASSSGWAANSSKLPKSLAGATTSGC